MTALYLIVGVLFVAVAFERSKKFGALLLVIFVLGMLLTAEKKGAV